MEEYELPIGRNRIHTTYRTVTPKGTHAKPPRGTDHTSKYCNTSYAFVMVSDFHGTAFAHP